MPMALGAKKKAFWFAAMTTLGSLAGAGIGYSIGYFLWWSSPENFSGVAEWFFRVVPGFHEKQFFKVQGLYDQYNFWIVFIAAFTPIPFKVITITAGAFQINLGMFLIASTIGRAARFFLVGTLLYFFGKPIKGFIERYFNWLSILFVIFLVAGFLVIKWVLDH